MRLLAEIKKKVSLRIQAAIKVAVRYVRDTAWTKRKIMSSGYSMYSKEEGTYYSELVGVVKAFISLTWNPTVFWHSLLVSVIKKYV